MYLGTHHVSMNFSPLSLFGLVTFIFDPIASLSKTNQSLSSVSPVEDEDGKQFYLNCTDANKVSQVHENETEITDRLCATILKSLFFKQVHKVYPVSRGTENKCVAKKLHSADTIEYHITPEYSVDSTGRRCRFVIQDEEVIAIAEQPASVSDFGFDAENTAETIETNLAIIGSVNGRDICNMTTFNKYRLCSTILNSQKYQPDVSFSPVTEPICLKKKLVSHRDEKLRWAFTKWAIECTATQVRKKDPETFCISSTVESSKHYVVSTKAESNTAIVSSLAEINLFL